MPTPWRLLPRAALAPPSRLHRRLISDARPFREHDHVILRPAREPNASPVLRGPLKAGKRIETHKGIVLHDDIIGKRVRDSVRTAPLRSGKPSADFRLYPVTLDEYVRLSRRLVTPIYPADANLIVSLLDLHPEVGHSADEAGPRLEILEAGTGHGALTLYLSRAVHAANPPKPVLQDAADPGSNSDSDSASALDAWKARRRAVIHTTDIAHQYSRHAEQTVRAFRQGLYADNVDFHVGDVGAWLAATLPLRDNQPFLSAAFLDLPNADTHLEAVACALRVDATLIAFNPSITQIMDCAAKVKKAGIPLELEKVVELGVNGGSGGREWDVRPVKPRAGRKKNVDAKSSEEGSEEGNEEGSEEAAANVESPEASKAQSSTEQVLESPELEPQGELNAAHDESKSSQEDRKWSMVCRPKVGDRVVGGGFLGVWKKQRI